MTISREPVDGAAPARPGPSRPVLPRAVLVLLGTAAAVVVAAGLRSASDLVAPIVLALILTIAVSPLASWARRRGWPSWAASALAMVAVYAIASSHAMRGSMA